MLSMRKRLMLVQSERNLLIGESAYLGSTGHSANAKLHLHITQLVLHPSINNLFRRFKGFRSVCLESLECVLSSCP